MEYITSDLLHVRLIIMATTTHSNVILCFMHSEILLLESVAVVRVLSESSIEMVFIVRRETSKTR